MTSKIENYQSFIVSDEKDPTLFSHILVEYEGKLDGEIVDEILENISTRYAWVYLQSRTNVLKVRIKAVETITRMHSIEEYDSQDYLVENSRFDM